MSDDNIQGQQNNNGTNHSGQTPSSPAPDNSPQPPSSQPTRNTPAPTPAIGDSQQQGPQINPRRGSEWSWKTPAAIIGVLATLGLIGGFFFQWDANNSGQVQADAAKNDDRRQQKEETEKQKISKGSPIRVSNGIPYFKPSLSALPGEIPDGASFPFGNGDPEYLQWLSESGAQGVQADATRVTIEALHEGTVEIQDIELDEVRCKSPLSGTLILPDSTGDGGDETKKISLGFNLDEPNQPARVTRYVDTGVERKTLTLSEPYFASNSVMLEQHDKRTFDLHFISLQQSCTFKAIIVTHSNGKLYRTPVKTPRGVFSVTAVAETYTFGREPSPNGIFPADPKFPDYARLKIETPVI